MSKSSLFHPKSHSTPIGRQTPLNQIVADNQSNANVSTAASSRGSSRRNHAQPVRFRADPNADFSYVNLRNQQSTSNASVSPRKSSSSGRQSTSKSTKTSKKATQSIEHVNKLPKPKKIKRKRRPGEVVYATIRHLQHTTHLLIRRLSFARVIRTISTKIGEDRALNFRWQGSAIDCIQEATEAFIVAVFDDARRAAAHAKRVTVMRSDLYLVLQLSGMADCLMLNRK